MGWSSPSVTDICFLLVVISFVAVDGYVFNGPFVFINNNILKCMLIKEYFGLILPFSILISIIGTI